MFRLRSIENSNDNLPLSLILVKPPRLVVGHAKISRLPRNPEGCWIESVVVCPSVRGKGFGRHIMDACNDTASKLGFTNLYLSTHDQQGFYMKLGYELCEPICYFGLGTLPVPRSIISITHMQSNSNMKKLTEKGAEMKSNANVTPVPPSLPRPVSNTTLIAKSYLKKAVQK